MLYILKIKGTDTIPDFVQIRDEDMSLKAYFRLSQLEQGLKKNNLTVNEAMISEINQIPFGKVHKFKNDE